MKNKFEINGNSNYMGFEIEGFHCNHCNYVCVCMYVDQSILIVYDLINRIAVMTCIPTIGYMYSTIVEYIFTETSLYYFTFAFLCIQYRYPLSIVYWGTYWSEHKEYLYIKRDATMEFQSIDDVTGARIRFWAETLPKIISLVTSSCGGAQSKS